MSYRKWLAILVAVVMILTLFPALGFASEHDDGCDECEPELIVDLIAGQNEVVGTVTVTNDDEQLCIKYELSDEALEDGWLLYETHWAVGTDLSDIPQTSENRWGTNPIPGQFPYGDDELEGVKYYTECISLEDLGFGICNDVYIAAHAVIEREECDVIEAPYSAYQVVDYDQGLRKDGSPVRVGRSNPEAVLSYDLGQHETNFFSLGFKFDEEGTALAEGGWIIVEFEYPILNTPGDDDLMIVEDTWGTYPLESADVYASKDGVTWESLGSADNTERTVNNIHTESYFDLDAVGMDWAKFIKVVDTTPIDAMPNDGDGYDLNTIVALSDYYDCTTYDETAWGEGNRFNERGNWGMYFTYKICPPEVCVPASVIYGVAGDGSTGSLWEIDVSGDSIVETRLIDIASVGGATQFYPNGLAYDDANNRLYYAVRSGSVTKLFMYDFENAPVEAATGLTGEVYGATWGDGSYWYIPNGTDDMRIVTSFDSNGLNGTNELFEENFAGGKSFNFGDIALDAEEGVIYVSTSFSGTNKEFFKYDLNKDVGDRYSLITATGGAVGLQLGFGEDGVLYGHNTFGQNPDVTVTAKEFFEVDKEGTASSLGIGSNGYNDLASGPSVCVD